MTVSIKPTDSSPDSPSSAPVLVLLAGDFHRWYPNFSRALDPLALAA